MRKLLMLPAVIATACAQSPPQAAPAQMVRDGIYTAAQAERGRAVYARECAVCHADNMRGGPGSAAVAGIGFQYLWQGRTVGDLFGVMRATMPPGRQGVLSDRQYADILAAILETNGFPAGEGEELPADPAVLSEIRLSWETGGQ
jgi:mono/diheme cytochrome c family protein